MQYFSRLMVLGLCLFSINFLSAQVCVPDSSFTQGGTYPDSIPGGCVNEFYEAIITVVVPADTTVAGFTVPIDSIILEEVLGGPVGMTLACAPTGCVFPGNSLGCGSYSGTPNTADTFLLDLVIRAHVTTFLGPLTLVDTVQDFYTLIISPGPSSSIAVSGANCGASDGSASVTPTAGTAPYTYSWSTGATDSALSNLAAGPYDVDITDASGCMESLTVNVPNVGNAPVIDTGASMVGWAGCADDLGGAINPIISGGAGALSYTWTTGDTTQDLSGVGGGSYTLTVSDAAGCLSSETFVIAAPDALIVSSGQEDVSCNGEADGLAEVSLSGGDGPYTFSWSTGSMDNVIDGLSGGEYTAYVSDSLGCADTLLFSILEPAAISLNLSSTGSPAGSAIGTATAAPSGGVPPFTYTWSNGDTTAMADSLASGTYTLAIEDANGCVAEGDVTVALTTSIAAELTAGISDLRLYPNPSRGTFTLALNLARTTSLAIDIMDLQGRIVQTTDHVAVGQFKTTISRQDLAAGMYMLRIRTENGQALRRMMIE